MGEGMKRARDAARATQKRKADPDPDGFERIAERTRSALYHMIQAITQELKENGDTTHPAIAVTAMSSAAIAMAVEFYFGANATGGVPMQVARNELDRLVDDYWKQSVVRHITNTTKAKSK